MSSSIISTRSAGVKSWFLIGLRPTAMISSSDDQLVEQPHAALDHVEVPVRDRIERAGENRSDKLIHFGLSLVTNLSISVFPWQKYGPYYTPSSPARQEIHPEGGNLHQASIPPL